jgi:hypothetical protein
MALAQAGARPIAFLGVWNVAGPKSKPKSKEPQPAVEDFETDLEDDDIEPDESAGV